MVKSEADHPRPVASPGPEWTASAEVRQYAPPWSRPELAPRRLLFPGENVLFAVRPSFLARYWGRVLLFVILILLFAAPLGQPAYDTNPFAYVFIGIPTILLVYYILVWSQTIYVLTDRRVLRVAGRSGSETKSAGYEQVERLSQKYGVSGGIEFELYGIPLAPGIAIGPERRIVWEAPSDPVRVYGFVQMCFVRRSQAVSPGAPVPFAPPTPQYPPPYAPPYAYPAPVSPNPPSYAPSPVHAPAQGVAPTPYSDPSPPPPPPPRPPAVPASAQVPASSGAAGWGTGDPAAASTVGSAVSPVAPTSATGTTVRCPACGMVIDSRQLNAAAPQCPRCLFPLSIS